MKLRLFLITASMLGVHDPAAGKLLEQSTPGAAVSAPTAGSFGGATITSRSQRFGTASDFKDAKEAARAAELAAARARIAEENARTAGKQSVIPLDKAGTMLGGSDICKRSDPPPFCHSK